MIIGWDPTILVQATEVEGILAGGLIMGSKHFDADPLHGMETRDEAFDLSVVAFGDDTPYVAGSADPRMGRDEPAYLAFDESLHPETSPVSKPSTKTSAWRSRAKGSSQVSSRQAAK